MKLPRRAYLIASGTVLLVLAGLATYAFWAQSRYLPRTTVAGVSIGGMTRDEAAAALASRVKAYDDRDLTLRYGDKSWPWKGSNFGSTFAADEELQRVWDAQKSGGWQDSLRQLALAPLAARSSEVGFKAMSDEGKQKLQDTVLKDIEKGAQETSLKLVPKGVEVIPGKGGEALDAMQLESAIYTLYRNGGSELALSLKPFQPELTPEQAADAKALADHILAANWTVQVGPQKTVDIKAATVASWLDTVVVRDAAGKATALGLSFKEDVVKAAVASWSEGVNVDPINARVGLDATGAVAIVTPGTDGVKVNQDATLATVKKTILAYKDATPRTLVATVETAQPAVRQDTLASLGLTQKIGSASTDYTGSPTNRKANIGVGQRKLDLILIQPGETFSTIGHLAPIDASTGYLPELVIKGTRTVPDYGGGLCQVSTTLFRSILNAGFPIVERQNHAYRVGYYEREVGPGLDATIYDPKPDFRWKNDLSHAVLLQSSITGNRITFDLYGTSDGRVATIGKPEILEETPPGDPIYLNTDTLSVGTKKQVETAHGGAKTSVTYTVQRDGKEINKQVFKSTYKPWPAQYLVGTKPAEATPAPTPVPTPAPTDQAAVVPSP